ncbi:MAG: quinone-dependent dihydroorotate dehydrogenase [Saprospiraceae bacterium]
MYKTFLKPLLFRLDPEFAHKLSMSLFKLALVIPGFGALLRYWYKLEHPSLKVHLMGLDFVNPVGLAAGFDKEGKYYKAMHHLGFSHVEIGTVTPIAQEGNEKPRLFRLPQDEALINRMGFNNAGMDLIAKRLSRKRPKGLIVGGNIGKNKNTSNDQAWADYERCFNALYPVVDYFVVNVSSPNTPNLRELQEKEPLQNLLSRLQNLNKTKVKPKPILLKIAPDLNQHQVDDIIEIAEATKIAGLIASNTTIERNHLQCDPERLAEIGAGGLSGKPLCERSTQMIRYLRKHLPKPFVIIGVGGIQDPIDAIEKMHAGADLVQIYTGLIYEGPSMVSRVLKEMANSPLI